ncbi:MAG: DUF4276 family protein [Acidobacteriales bacterium]|nr:DUF4276 family protein [Terriglobales bacterium]
MNRLLVLVEGQTEERFIKEVVQPHLWSSNVSAEPKIVMTKRVIGASSHKGGGDFGKAHADILRLLADTNAVAVSTFFDFYGFPKSLPGAGPDTFQDIDKLTAAIEATVSNPRFKAYLQKHEFEAFLFVDPQTTAVVAMQPDRAAALAAHRNGFTSAEDINLGPETAPSKRIASTMGRYSKLLTGPVAAQRIGIQRLRADCPRFDTWMSWAESLG